MVGGGNDEGGGRPAVRGWWLDGVLPHPLTAPLDSGLRRNDEVGGADVTNGGAGDGAVRGWWLDGGLPHPSPPLLDSRFRGNDELGGGYDDGGGAEGLLGIWRG